MSKVIEADKQARESSPTFMRNRSLTKGAEGGVETFKLRSKLLKTKLTKAEVENLMEELTKCKIVTIEDLVGLDQDAILALSVKPHVRAILFQVAKKHNGTIFLLTFRLSHSILEVTRAISNPTPCFWLPPRESPSWSTKHWPALFLT